MAGTPERKNVVREGTGGRTVQDVGGLDFGPIDRSEHDLALWEKRTDAMLNLLTGPKKAAFKIDAMRRVIESYSEQEYDRTQYYEKWIRALRNLIVEQEIVTAKEIEARMAELRKKHTAAGRRVSKEKIAWE